MTTKLNPGVRRLVILLNKTQNPKTKNEAVQGTKISKHKNLCSNQTEPVWEQSGGEQETLPDRVLVMSDRVHDKGSLIVFIQDDCFSVKITGNCLIMLVMNIANISVLLVVKVKSIVHHWPETKSS